MPSGMSPCLFAVATSDPSEAAVLYPSVVVITPENADQEHRVRVVGLWDDGEADGDKAYHVRVTALAMPDDAVLSIRDGARGSLLYGDGWFARVPAVELDAVADPTGAGNAFAGALAAGFVEQRARAQPTREAALAAAAVATAVGAAMCKTAGWAPADVAEARRWAARSSARVEIT